MIHGKTTYWRLTVHWYPHAAEAGIRPFIYSGFAEERVAAGGYHPHHFDFKHPPSRGDFLEACHAHQPWTQVWKDTLLPLIRAGKCEWPMIDSLHKASSATILDGQGREVGKLDVRRHEFFNNEPYTTTYIPVDLRDRLTQGYKGEARQSVRDFIDACENQIREALSIYGRPPTPDDVKTEIRKVIALWRQERAKRGKETCPATS